MPFRFAARRRGVSLPMVALAWVALALALGAVILAPGHGPPLAPVGPSSASAVPSTAPDPAPPIVSIAPGSWMMEAGASVVFFASIVGFASGCSGSSATILWSLPGVAEYDGTLNASVGGSVRFTSLPSASGALTVAAHADGTMECEGTAFSYSADGSADVALEPEVAVGTLGISPDPATPGGRVLLEWSVSGGVAPYTAEVSFGDGASTTLSVPSAGSPSVVHRYAAGEFEPVVRMVDSTGAVVDVGASEPLVVAGGLGVAIALATESVDAGVPFTLRANVSGGIAPYGCSWSDSLGEATFLSNWTLTIPTAENLTVRLTVTDSVGDTSSVVRALAVVDPPQLNVTTALSSVDAGRTFPIAISVLGGVGPYHVRWGFPPNGTTTTAVLATAGTVSEPATAPVPGEVWVTAGIVDAAGAERSLTVPLVEAFPPVSVTLVQPPAIAEAGVPLAFTAVVDGGAVPIRWTWTGSPGGSNGSTSSGTLDGPGELRWDPTFPPGPPVDWLLSLTDATGATSVLNGTVALVAALTATLSLGLVGTASVGTVPATATVSGGAPPYAYTITWSNDEASSGNLSEAGTLELTATAAAPGVLAARLVVDDPLGGHAAVSSRVDVASLPATSPNGSASPSDPPTANDPGASLGSWAVGLGGLGAAAALFVLPRWKRRPFKGRRGGEDRAAMGVVRRLLKDSDGLERETLYFLAEDDGVSPAAAAEAVDRWERAGRLRSEAGTDGSDLLQWVDPATERASDDPAEVDG